MAEFVAISENVEVSGDSILAFINSMERGKDTRSEILKNHGIDPEGTTWYSQLKWLEAFKEVSYTLGEMNLFLIGKSIVNNSNFPPVCDLEEALNTLDVAYHMNHRINGKVMFDPISKSKLKGIGNYKLLAYDATARKATFKCTNPYPSKFDEGIIAQLVRKFRPSDSIKQTVELDLSKDSRIKGGDSCTYLISW